MTFGTFDSAERDYLYPVEKEVRCACCGCVIDPDECTDPACEMCDLCYQDKTKTDKDDGDELSE